MSDADKQKAKRQIIHPPKEIGYRAVWRGFRSPPDKVRIMGRTVIGRPADQALTLLKFSPNKSAMCLWKVINSAVHNASNNFELDVDKLYVERIFVDRGSMLKSYHPCAHGRAKPILKRTCHVTVQLQYRGTIE